MDDESLKMIDEDKNFAGEKMQKLVLRKC